ncbi:MAG TPA: MFS transporter [Microlunatus sp.]
MTIRQASNNRQAHTIGTAKLALLAIGTFTLGMDSMVLAGLLPQVASDLQVSVSTAGQLTTIFAITYAISSPLIATLTGRLDRRTVLAGGMIIFLVGITGQALGTTFLMVAISRVLAAIGAAGFQANAYAVAGLLAEEGKRGRALATISTGGTVSTVIGTPFGVLIGQSLGWRTSIWVIAALAAISALVVPLLPAVRMPAVALRQRIRVLGQPRVLAILAGTTLILLPTFAVLSYLPVLAAPVVTGSLLAVAMVINGGGQVIGNQVAGRVIDARGALPVVIIALAGSLLCLVVLPVARQSAWSLLLILLLLGCLAGANIVPQQHRLFTVAGDAATTALGLNGSAIYLGIALGSAIGGLSLKIIGVGWLPVVAAVLAAFALLIIWTTAPERRAQHSRVHR